MTHMFDTVRAAAARVSKLPASTDLGLLTAAELSLLVSELGRLRAETERVLAWSAAEVNRRSAVGLGGAGLAKAAGYANTEALIAVLTGTSRSEARKIDRLGRSLMQATDIPPDDPAGVSVSSSDGVAGAGVSSGVGSGFGTDGSEGFPGDGSGVRPWFAVVTEPMIAGRITPDRCEAIRAGLGEATDTITNAVLADAATRLLDLLHPDDSPETVFRDARQMRALLDRDGVAADETALQNRQQAKVWSSRDGMVHLRADFAPEDGAWVKNTLDLILGPRIGGPRFAGPTTPNTHTGTGTGGSAQSSAGPVGDETRTDGASRTAAHRITDDSRSTEQLRASTLLGLLKAGTEIDDNAILARKRPAVQVIITADELTRADDTGIAFIEGSRYPVTRRTIDRLVCDTGYIPLITTPAGTPLDLGRTVRLFTPTQRAVLATLQGGCIWNGCDKPPSMCEAHHITPWSTHGTTNIQDGVLLCRYHHQQLHNHNWRITRTTQPEQAGQPEGSEQSEHAHPRYENSYWLTPPPSQDPEQKPIQLRFRAPAHPPDHAMKGRRKRQGTAPSQNFATAAPGEWGRRPHSRPAHSPAYTSGPAE